MLEDEVINLEGDTTLVGTHNQSALGSDIGDDSINEHDKTVNNRESPEYEPAGNYEEQPVLSGQDLGPTEIMVAQCREDVDKNTSDTLPSYPVLELPVLAEFEENIVTAEQPESPDEPLGSYSVVSSQTL